MGERHKWFVPCLGEHLPTDGSPSFGGGFPSRFDRKEAEKAFGGTWLNTNRQREWGGVFNVARRGIRLGEQVGGMKPQIRRASRAGKTKRNTNAGDEFAIFRPRETPVRVAAPPRPRQRSTTGEEIKGREGRVMNPGRDAALGPTRALHEQRHGNWSPERPLILRYQTGGPRRTQYLPAQAMFCP